ncbi:MAG TPA: aldose epimerase family protein [Acidobacteriaceae bacterium]|nr:aldose epimerase family protein [Acidobacteriaceae bacterium]
MTAALNSRVFGIAPDGTRVDAWTLEGACGLTLEIITYGASVTRLLAPDREGRLADVVLGFDNLSAYSSDPGYFGSVVGRVAGRISNAQFSLDKVRYELVSNDPPNHLHGGQTGFDKRIWKATPTEAANGNPSLRLNYRSPHLEEGYPGTLDVAVTYTVTEHNVLTVEMRGEADRPTPFSLTLHPYFNLAGEGVGSIVDHELQIHADEFIATDEFMTLQGKVTAVVDTGNDFRCPRVLREAIPCLFRNHGDLYVIRRGSGEIEPGLPVPAARLAHPASGRELQISTTATHIQLYTAAALDGSLTGKSGIAYPRYAGVCLECEGYPDGANHPHLGDIILRPGSPRQEVTAYAFGCI